MVVEVAVYYADGTKARIEMEATVLHTFEALCETFQVVHLEEPDLPDIVVPYQIVVRGRYCSPLGKALILDAMEEPDVSEFLQTALNHCDFRGQVAWFCSYVKTLPERFLALE